jgi:hypothetical protein
MNNRIISILMVSLLVIGGFIGIFTIMPDDAKATGPTYIGGLISTDTTLTLVNSPYIINWNTLVEKGVTLTIEPGVEVRFEDFYYLQIEGKIIADGTEEDMIIFTSNKTLPAPGDWDAIKIMKNCDFGSSITYCIVEYSGGFNGWGSAIYIEGDLPLITNNYFTNNYGGVCIRNDDPYDGTFHVENNTFINNPGPGSTGQAIIIDEYSTNIEVIISNNIIINNKGSGIWIRSRTLLNELTIIDNNTIQDNSGGGIWFVSSNPYINVTNNLITNNSWGGIVFQAGINEIPGVIERNTITFHEEGIRIEGVEDIPEYSWQYNNIHDNSYNVKNTDVNDWYMLNNWWGTTDTDLINQSIYDYWDDFNLGEVIYMPFLKEEYEGKSITIKHGSNLISLPTVQPGETLEEVLAPILGDYLAVQWYDPTDNDDPWKHYHASKPSSSNDLDTIDHTMAFFVYKDTPGETDFVFNGDKPTENQMISMHPGWNLVGYPSTSDKLRDDALNNLEFETHVDAIWTYDNAEDSWDKLGPTDYFEVGKGYWMHSTVEASWEVPL